MAVATFTYTGIPKDSSGGTRAIKLSSYSEATNFSGVIDTIQSITVTFFLGITNTAYNRYFLRAAFASSKTPARQANSFYALSASTNVVNLNYSNFTADYSPNRISNIELMNSSTQARTNYFNNTYITVTNSITASNIETIFNNGYLVLYAANRNGGFTSADLGDYRTSTSQQFSTNTANLVWGATSNYKITITVNYTTVDVSPSTIITINSKTANNTNNTIDYSLTFTSSDTILDATVGQLQISKYTAGASNGGWGDPISIIDLTWAAVKNGYSGSLAATLIDNYDSTVSYGLCFRLIMSGIEQAAEASLNSITTDNTSGTTAYVGNVTLVNPYGVSFGQESTSTATNPKFECAYPAYFPNGISLGGSIVQTSWPSGGGSSINFKFLHGTLTGWPTTGDTSKIISLVDANFTALPYIGLTIRYAESNTAWEGSVRVSSISTTEATIKSHLTQTTTSANVTYSVDWFAIGT